MFITTTYVNTMINKILKPTQFDNDYFNLFIFLYVIVYRRESKIESFLQLMVDKQFVFNEEQKCLIIQLCKYDKKYMFNEESGIPELIDLLEKENEKKNESHQIAGGQYYQKYIKYKHKYLQIKNK